MAAIYETAVFLKSVDRTWLQLLHGIVPQYFMICMSVADWWRH